MEGINKDKSKSTDLEKQQLITINSKAGYLKNIQITQ